MQFKVSALSSTIDLKMPLCRCGGNSQESFLRFFKKNIGRTMFIFSQVANNIIPMVPVRLSGFLLYQCLSCLS